MTSAKDIEEFIKSTERFYGCSIELVFEYSGRNWKLLDYIASKHSEEYILTDYHVLRAYLYKKHCI